MAPALFHPEERRPVPGLQEQALARHRPHRPPQQLHRAQLRDHRVEPAQALHLRHPGPPDDHGRREDLPRRFGRREVGTNSPNPCRCVVKLKKNSESKSAISTFTEFLHSENTTVLEFPRSHSLVHVVLHSSGFKFRKGKKLNEQKQESPLFCVIEMFKILRMSHDAFSKRDCPIYAINSLLVFCELRENG